MLKNNIFKSFFSSLIILIFSANIVNARFIQKKSYFKIEKMRIQRNLNTETHRANFDELYAQYSEREDLNNHLDAIKNLNELAQETILQANRPGIDILERQASLRERIFLNKNYFTVVLLNAYSYKITGDFLPNIPEYLKKFILQVIRSIRHNNLNLPFEFNLIETENTEEFFNEVSTDYTIELILKILELSGKDQTIQSINFKRINITKIPVNLKYFINLRVLNLSDNPRLTELSDIFQNFQNLEELNLQRLNLIEKPQSLLRLKEQKGQNLDIIIDEEENQIPVPNLY